MTTEVGSAYSGVTKVIVKGDMMAYSHVNSKGQTYYLHSKEVELRGGHKRTIYFFAKDIRPNALDALPEGYEVKENVRNGFLTLKKVS